MASPMASDGTLTGRLQSHEDYEVYREAKHLQNSQLRSKYNLLEVELVKVVLKKLMQAASPLLQVHAHYKHTCTQRDRVLPTKAYYLTEFGYIACYAFVLVLVLESCMEADH